MGLGYFLSEGKWRREENFSNEARGRASIRGTFKEYLFRLSRRKHFNVYLTFKLCISICPTSYAHVHHGADGV